MRAVSNIIGIWDVWILFFSRLHNSIPFIIGIITSLIIKLGSLSMAIFSPSNPSFASITWYHLFNSSFRKFLNSVLSSTNKIIGLFGEMEDESFSLFSCTSSFAAIFSCGCRLVGRHIVNVVPLLAMLVTSIFPWSRFIYSLARCRPIPLPVFSHCLDDIW